MKTGTGKNTCIDAIPVTNISLATIAEQIDFFSIFQSVFLKANSLHLNDVYIPQDTSLFIDTRKQSVFDWRKNTNAYQRIIHLSDLEDKWDGYNAPRFFTDQIDLALTLYSHLRTYCIRRGLDFSKVEPFIAPCSDGMVLFEWAGNRFPQRQVEIYVSTSAEHPFEYLKTEGESDVEGEFHLEELYPILDWLFKIQ